MKPHVLTLQDMEQDSLQFDLSAGSLEELFEWYQLAWDITQREMSKQYNRVQEVSISQTSESFYLSLMHVQNHFFLEVKLSPRVRYVKSQVKSPQNTAGKPTVPGGHE